MRGIFTRAAVGIALLGLLMAPVAAQSPVQTLPSPTPQLTNASTTIAVTNTFQAVFPASTGRRGCTIQNNSATNAMYVYFGDIASATTSNSVKIAAGQAVYCGVLGGITITNAVSITGTSGDAFYAALQ